jgi:hypothetical protein
MGLRMFAYFPFSLVTSVEVSASSQHARTVLHGVLPIDRSIDSNRSMSIHQVSPTMLASLFILLLFIAGSGRR